MRNHTGGEGGPIRFDRQGSISMPFAGHAGSSSGCVAKPKEQEIGSAGYLAPHQHSKAEVPRVLSLDRNPFDVAALGFSR